MVQYRRLRFTFDGGHPQVASEQFKAIQVEIFGKPRPAANQSLLMRFTIIDSAGAVSFRGPGHVMKMLAAACSFGASSFREALAQLQVMDAALAEKVLHGLSRFDEHCLESDSASVDQWVGELDASAGDPFRVYNQTMRRASLQPEPLGIVIFNLHERRIVQVENRYGALLRSDRGRIRKESKPTSRFYAYELSPDWAILP